MAKELTPVLFPKGDGCLLAKVNVLREIQSAGGEELRRLQAESQAELDALLPYVLDRAFKGAL